MLANGASGLQCATWYGNLLSIADGFKQSHYWWSFLGKILSIIICTAASLSVHRASAMPLKWSELFEYCRMSGSGLGRLLKTHRRSQETALIHSDLCISPWLFFSFLLGSLVDTKRYQEHITSVGDFKTPCIRACGYKGCDTIIPVIYPNSIHLSSLLSIHANHSRHGGHQAIFYLVE